MIPITIQNRQRRIAVDLPALRKFAARALPEVLRLRSNSDEKLSTLDELSIALISDRAIAKIHRTFMDIAGPTDVLTFDHGEVLISAETAARYAVEYGHTTQQEIALYILHGLLHLRGFDDTTPEAHREMHAIQNEIFARL